MAHQIVFIGASFGALPAAQALLRDILPKLPADSKQSYKVTLISPSVDFYWKIGSPRTIVNPKALPVERIIIPIAPEFKQYGAERFEFIHASAESIDSAAKSVKLSNGSSVTYNSLVIASGTSFISPIWSVAGPGGSSDTLAALKDIHERLPQAKTVVVAGGGAAGTETAGELGTLYGKKKDITILSGSTQLLSKLQNKKVGVAAGKKLEGMGVKVINDRLQVESAKRQPGGETLLQFSDGSSRTVDVFIEATGDRPNSNYIPTAWVNEKGYVKTDPRTLRLDVPGVENVYCIGSVGSYSDGSIFDIKFALPALLESIKLDLLAIGGHPDKGKRKTYYNKIQSDMQIVPVGPSGGVGALFGYQVPSMFVWMIKSRDFMIGNAVKTVNGTA